MATPKSETIKTDIVILGGSGSGLAAAVQAAELGAKVVIVEKRPVLGGNSTVSGAFFACDSPAQKRADIDAPADFFFKKMVEFSHWKVNARLCRAWINKSGQTIKWLEDKGLIFAASLGNSVVPDHNTRSAHRPAAGGSPGGAICKLLISEVERLGVRVLFNTTAKEILKDGNNVVGALAESADTRYRIEAKALILCTGGYPNNKEMIKKYNPGFSADSIYVGIPEVVGEGLEMALKVGIATDSLGFIHYMGLHFPGNSAVISRINSFPQNLWLNKKGERFCDETVVFDMGTRGNALEKQLGRMAYVVFDDKLKDIYIENHKEQSAATETKARSAWVDLPRDLQAEDAKGNVKVCQNWDEAAHFMKVPAAVVKASIEEYNAACERGYDEVFLKEKQYLHALKTPPFYVVKNGSDYPCTLGGVKVNHRFEVLNPEEDPIPGFYCAGTEAGGWESETYSYFLHGSILAFRVVSGQMAGENASRYVLGK